MLPNSTLALGSVLTEHMQKAKWIARAKFDDQQPSRNKTYGIDKEK